MISLPHLTFSENANIFESNLLQFIAAIKEHEANALALLMWKKLQIVLYYFCGIHEYWFEEIPTRYTMAMFTWPLYLSVVELYVEYFVVKYLLV